jgi:uncharacterized protein
MKKICAILINLSLLYFSCAWSNDSIEPSFDCKKAKNALQQTICAEPGLAELDQQLDFAYDKTYYSAIKPEIIQHEQKKWLEELANTSDQEAIKSAFQSRIETLSAQAEKQYQALKQLKPYPVMAIKYFRHNRNKAVQVRVNSYFLKTMYGATFDGLSAWLFDDDENDSPVASYVFSRIKEDDNDKMDKDKMEVNSCASYDQAIKGGYSYYVGPTHPGPEEEIHYDLRDCKIIELFKKAKPAKRSYLRDLAINQLDENAVTALAKKFFDEYKPTKLTDLKFYPAIYLTRMTFDKGSENELNMSFKILGWGDFIGNGLDNMLVEVHSRIHNSHGHASLNKVFIITRKQPNAALEIVKLIDEIA